MMSWKWEDLISVAVVVVDVYCYDVIEGEVWHDTVLVDNKSMYTLFLRQDPVW